MYPRLKILLQRNHTKILTNETWNIPCLVLFYDKPPSLKIQENNHHVTPAETVADSLKQLQ